MKRIVVTAAMVAVATSACRGVDLPIDLGSMNTVAGSGVVTEEKRQVEPFEEIEISNAIQATVVVGDAPGVVVSGDDNILALLETTVAGGRLEVGYPPNTVVRPSRSIEVRITVARLAYLEASGASTVDLQGLAGSEVRLVASGASTITAAGTVDRLEAEASGASHVDAGELTAGSATVDASGASSVSVDVLEDLDASASGASNVCYRRKPGSVRPSASGASSVGECGR